MRNKITVTVEASGRDKGKVFIIEEMPAVQGAKWAARAFLALAKNGIDIPDNIASAGLAGVAVIGLKMLGGMSFADLDPLLDELMRCVKIVRNPKVAPMPLMDDDFEEIETIVWLHQEILGCHVAFSKLAALLTSASAASKKADTPTT